MTARAPAAAGAQPIEHAPVTALLPALRSLDLLLARAIALADELYGPDAARDPLRGLHIGVDEIGRLLAREPGMPLFGGAAEPGGLGDLDLVSADDGSPLAWLGRRFGLDGFETGAALVALAPEIDLRYERLYACLHDDVTKRRPTVDLVLNLLCSSVEEKARRRSSFSSSAPLVRHRLIHLVADPGQPSPPLLGRSVRLDEQIVDALLGAGVLDRRLAGWCRVVPDGHEGDLPLPLAPDRLRALASVVADARAGGGRLQLHLEGPRGSGRLAVGRWLARHQGVPLLVADLERAPVVEEELEEALHVLFREAQFFGAIVYLENFDPSAGPSDGRPDGPSGRLLDVLAADGGVGDGGVTVLASERPWHPSARGPARVATVVFPMPSARTRRERWEANLRAARLDVAPDDVEALATRFRLTPGQIAGAVTAAGLRATVDGTDLARSLFGAARSQVGHDLAAVARKIEPAASWDDIVLPADAATQLVEICDRVTNRPRVLEDWGFGRKLSRGTGVNVLFAGPSGTGKTMAAEIIARRLELELYRIDLAGVVSKYIGETEKNLDRVFRAAENASAVLLFDEAEALFGKRSEVRDSHDRYANIEIAYLLTKMEEYDGLAILATNLRQNLDEAFVRRLAFSVHFPFPDEASRLRIWAGIWPPETPVADDVDRDLLACRFKLSGGNIKNAALAAAFLAAGEDRPVSMRDVMHAVRREHQKMGKPLSEAELGSAPVGGDGP